MLEIIIRIYIKEILSLVRLIYINFMPLQWVLLFVCCLVLYIRRSSLAQCLYRFMFLGTSRPDIICIVFIYYALKETMSFYKTGRTYGSSCNKQKED